MVSSSASPTTRPKSRYVSLIVTFSMLYFSRDWVLVMLSLRTLVIVVGTTVAIAQMTLNVDSDIFPSENIINKTDAEKMILAEIDTGYLTQNVFFTL